MNLPHAPHTEYIPLFDWSPKRDRKLSLFGFTAASALLHALCFYVFQIIYPPTVALLPPPARVNVITANTEEGRALLRWVEAEDPALSSTTQRPVNAPSFALLQRAHVPSFVNRQPALQELPLHQPDLSVPTSRPPGPAPTPPTRTIAPASPAPTNLSFLTNTGALVPSHTPLLKFVRSSPDLPEAAQFRIGIGSRGEVRHCFLDHSSGDSRLDEQARDYLMLCRFPAIGGQPSAIRDNLLWAAATIEWGNDLSPVSPLSSEASTP